MAGVLRIAEAGVLALFFVTLERAWRARRRDGGRGVAILVSGFAFAWAFEQLNVVAGTGRGSYFYSAQFAAWLGEVPVFIVAAWAVILWSALELSQAQGGPLWARVARVALWATLLDLAFDVTAVRHRMWIWRSVGWDEAWFGVPASNFFGWLWVSLAFALVTLALDAVLRRPALLRWRFLAQVLFVPPFALLLYRLLEHATNSVLRRAAWTSDTRSLAAFGAALLVVAVVAGVGGPVARSSRHTLRFARSARAAFHLFAVVGLLVLPASPLLQQQQPAMLLIAGLLWAWEWWRLRLTSTQS